MGAVRDNKALGRFELDVEGAVAFANYRITPQAVVITHTETPRALRGRVLDSNLFQPGSTWELWATDDDAGSVVEVRAVRHLRGRGWLIAPFFLPFMPGSAQQTVRDHLRHFLAGTEADR